jgi:hypothetical protein
MNLLELQTPCLVLDRSKMERNIASLHKRLARLGVNLRPHGKTAKTSSATPAGTPCPAWLFPQPIRSMGSSASAAGPRRTRTCFRSAAHSVSYPITPAPQGPCMAGTTSPMEALRLWMSGLASIGKSFPVRACSLCNFRVHGGDALVQRGRAACAELLA